MTFTPPIRAEILPDEISERYIAIRATRHHGDGPEIVTIIEVLSPTNKLPGSECRTHYMAMRDEILYSRTHLIEIDLLRAGTRSMTLPIVDHFDYLIKLSRVEDRPHASFWPVPLESRVPQIPVPLLPGDDDIALDMQRLLNQVYDDPGYERRLDYSQPPPAPDLSDPRRQWLRSYLPPAQPT